MATSILLVPATASASACSKLLRNPNVVKAALVAYRPEGALSFERFSAKITALIEEASQSQAQLVVFPELLVQDLVDHGRGEDSFGPQVRELSRHWPRFLELYQHLANEYGMFIYTGTFPRQVNGRIFNSGALIEPNGRVGLVQDKLYMTPFEKIWGISPGSELQVYETPWGKWVNLTCYDCEIPKLSNELAEIQPTLILVPSMTEAVSGFHRVRWTAQARAIEHKAFVLHTGMTGGPESWPNYGQCSVTGPYDDVMCGTVAESQANTPGLLVVNLDFSKLKKSRASSSVYPGRDQTEVGH